MLPDPKRLHIEDNLMEENKAKDNTNVVNGETFGGNVHSSLSLLFIDNNLEEKDADVLG